MKAFISREPFSYRQDVGVPDFDDNGPVTIVDGDCALCTIGARLIARFDRSAEFRICPTQTELGSALLRHYGLDANDPESWLYIVDGSAFTSLDGMIRAGARVGGAGWLFATPETNATIGARLALPKNRPQPLQVIWTERDVCCARSCAPRQTDEMKVVILGGYGVFGSRLA